MAAPGAGWARVVLVEQDNLAGGNGEGDRADGDRADGEMRHGIVLAGQGRLLRFASVASQAKAWLTMRSR